jgi:hypothetical protein
VGAVGGGPVERGFEGTAAGDFAGEEAAADVGCAGVADVLGTSAATFVVGEEDATLVEPGAFGRVAF